MTSSPSMLAAFVWPTLFYSGAAAVSIPIVIHLLARRRFKRIRWAAIEFLLQAEKRNKRRIRLEEMILLMLRCLAVLLIALLIARPFIRPEGLAALLGGADRNERIFVIDDSFSMGYRSGSETTFNRAKKAVTQLVKLFRDQSPQDTVTILRTSAMDTPILADALLDQRQTEEIYTRVQGLQVSHHALASRDAMESVRRLLDQQPETINATIYVVSDFQRKDWVDTSRDNRETDASPIAPLADWQNENRGLKLVLVDIGDDEAENVAVTSLNSDRTRFVAGVAATLQATVANHTRDTQSLNLEVGVGPITQTTVAVRELHSGDTTTVSIPVTTTRPGWESLHVQTAADALPVDDSRSLVVETIDAVKVLIVNGEPSSDVYRDEVALLQTAIRPPGEVFSGNEAVVIDETGIEDTNLNAYGAVILTNVYRLSAPAAELLDRYVFEGGGVAFFLGDQVDPDFYNETLFADGHGLLPARLDERRTAPASGVRLVPRDELHPIVRVFAGSDNPFAKHIAFYQYFACSLGDDQSAENPDSSTDTSTDPAPTTNVIAVYSDADQSPAILERSYGQGRVMLFTTSCDLEWNDWGKDPSYVVSMLELVQHLARGRGGRSDHLVGAPITLPVDPAKFEAGVRVRTPAYPAEAEVPITAIPDEGGRGLQVVWDRTNTSGVYQFVLTDHGGTERTRSVAVNLDPEESDLTPAVEADLRQSLHELPFDYVAGLNSLDEVTDEARRELWKSVLAAALLVLMSEQFLAWWFGRRA